MPNYFVCYCYFLLHKYDESENLGLICLRANCNSHLPSTRRTDHLELDTHDVTGHVYYLFYFLDFQLPIKRFSYGLQCEITVE